MDERESLSRDGPLPWQWEPWRRLVASIDEGRLPHALLLIGRRGSGKRLFAEALAARLLCGHPGEEGMACGRCRGCRLFLAGNHPDVLHLEPPPDKEAIVVDQVRELIDRVGLASSQQGGHRVIVVDPAERLNPAAANALLKILEEPGPGVVFCLVCSRPTALPATIRSRCQSVRLPMPAKDEALRWLVSRVSDERLSASALDACFGAPLPALRLALDGDDAFPDVGEDLLALARGERGPVEVAGAWLKIDAQRSLYGLVACLSALLRRILAPDDEPCSAGGAAVSELAAAVRDPLPAARRIFGLVDRCFEAQRLLETPVNRPLLFEQLAIEWLRACRASAGDRPPP